MLLELPVYLFNNGTGIAGQLVLCCDIHKACSFQDEEGGTMQLNLLILSRSCIIVIQARAS